VTSQDTLLSLGDERFVSLSTYRKDGSAVPTTVWIARDGAGLIVLTPPDSGKVKRIRNDPRVALVPCSRRGTVADGATPVQGWAEVVADEAETDRLWDVIRRKYGLEYRLVLGIERLVARGQRPRVIVRVTTC
jgi:PPOX class probable F420-dependent enzyme